MKLIERIYRSAAHAGLLQDCLWRPSDGSPPQHHPVGFAAPDETVLDGLTLSTNYTMTYPASCFTGLAPRDSVEINGVGFVVREIRAVGDGAEMRASLTRI